MVIEGRRWSAVVRQPLTTMIPVPCTFRGSVAGSGFRSGRRVVQRARLVRAGGLEPPRATAQRIFIPLRLSPPPEGVWGLDYPFTVPRKRGVGAARLVSTPSRRRAWLGIAILQGSPNLSSSTARVSPRALKLSSKSGASTIPPRPHTKAVIGRGGIAAKDDLRSVRISRSRQLEHAFWALYER